MVLGTFISVYVPFVVNYGHLYVLHLYCSHSFRQIGLIVWATDGLGVCSAMVDPQCVTTAAAACGVPPPNVNRTVVDNALCAARWDTIISSPWSGAEEHINVYELRAVMTAVRRIH